MNDSVREELETQIKPGLPRTVERASIQPARVATPVQPARVEVVPRMEAAPRVEPVAPRVEAAAPVAPRAEAANAAKPAPAVPRVTQEFHSSKTSPTLVEFQAKQTTVPDWRLALQNSVRQRRGGSTATVAPESAPKQARLSTRGAAALKAEPVAEGKLETPSPAADPRVAAALKRIDNSRKTFAPPPAKPGLTAAKSPVAREFPFNVVSRSAEVTTSAAPVKKATVNPAPRPKLISTFKIEKGGYDTNKLPPLQAAANPVIPEEAELELIDIHETAAEQEIVLHVEESIVDDAETAASEESTDDIAPIAMRFNAGLFDVIIGAFASFVLFSPLIFMGGDWFTASGMMAFFATWAIVMFVYMTAAIGMYGRTIGMRMFSLELIDAEENDYPTFHQAAVSAAVYLLTIPVLGLGFLPALFNEEQRAAYDLASGTIVVTEF